MKTDNDPITSFRGPYWFLSNFYPVVIRFNGHDFRTLEHAYQASKTVDVGLQSQIFRAATPGQAKYLGGPNGIIKMTAAEKLSWGSDKLLVMERLLRQKFNPEAHPDLLVKLVETWPRKLIEGNTWGDRFWGAVQDKSENGWPWVGDNHLGLILMKIRSEWVDGVESTG